MKTDHRTQLYLAADEYGRAMSYARRHERSLASVAREALDAFLSAREGKEIPPPFGDDPADGLVGLCGGGGRGAHGDAAADHDEALATLLDEERPRRRRP